MGPRPLGRGRGTRARRPPIVPPASMGPRPLGRGRSRRAPPPARASRRVNGAATSRPRKARRLMATSPVTDERQWGRDLSAAEGVRQSSTGNEGGVRQWGRDLSAAEGLTCWWGAPSWCGRVNGAATSRPRKEHCLDGRRRVGSCVNGAATSRPRKVLSKSRASGRCSCRVNGAATSRPRKENISWDTLEPDERQWGRDLSAAEGMHDGHAGWGVAGVNGAATSRPRKAPAPARRGRRRPASMGPRPLGRGRPRARGSKKPR